MGTGAMGNVLRRRRQKSVPDVLDGQLARLSPFYSALVLTAAAIAVIVPAHFLIRHLQDLPVQPAAALNLVAELTVVLLPMIYYARRKIEELRQAKTEAAAMSRRPGSRSPPRKRITPTAPSRSSSPI
jgi:hypothetical protein